MSNSKVKEKVEVNGVMEKTMEEKIDEAIESLKAQFANFSKQEEESGQGKLKCQGALEVLLQLHPQKENNEN